MMFHRGLGMLHGDVVQTVVAPVLRGPEQHLQIYHVVHDGVVAAKHFHIAGPRQDGAHVGIEQCSQRIGRGEYHLFITRIVRQTVAVAIAAEHQEAEVMVKRRPMRQEL